MSNTNQDETSLQVDTLTTDAPPTYNDAVHQLSISGHVLETQRHQQASPPPYHPVQQGSHSAQQADSVHQADNVTPTGREEVVIVPPPQPVILNIVTERPRPRPRRQGSVAELNYEDIGNIVYQRLRNVVWCSLLLTVIGTPLALVASIPSYYCIHKAKRFLEDGQLTKANSWSEGSFLYIGMVVFFVGVFVTPLAVLLAIIFALM